MEFKSIISTDGSGEWSDVAKGVVVGILDLIHLDEDFYELRVYFDTSSWNNSENGLIYTDEHFLKELKAKLVYVGLTDNIQYSDKDLQGENYVHFIAQGQDFFDKYTERKVALENRDT